jgi:hypothetical protein
MNRTIRGISCAAVAVVLCAGPALASPTLNEGNDFEMGTLQGWATVTGAPQPESVNSGGNPDRFLRVTADGGTGAGSQLFAFNRSMRWTGNYKSTNVGAVTIDLKNLGAAPLSMRLAFRESGGTWYAANDAYELPADGTWHSTQFDLLASEFTALEGATPFDTGMTRVSEFRVLHSTDVDYTGDVIAASFGMDNLLAVVPEPAGAALGVFAAAGALLRRPRQRRLARR